jgi:hypothetical protein
MGPFIVNNYQINKSKIIKYFCIEEELHQKASNGVSTTEAVTVIVAVAVTVIVAVLF